MTDPAESIDNVSQDLEESGPIVLVEEDALARIAGSSNSSCAATAKLLRMSSR